MKGNEFSARELNTDAVVWVRRLHQTLIVKEYGKGTIRNYCQEMKLLFKYYNHKFVSEITQADIEQYLQYIKEVHKVGRAKCRSVAAPDSYREQLLLQAGDAIGLHCAVQPVSPETVCSP